MSNQAFDPAGNGWVLTGDRRFPSPIAPFWMREHESQLNIGILCDASHDNGNGAMHGGLLATLADVGLGRMVGRHRNVGRDPNEPRLLSATIQLDISYCGRVEIGEFVYSTAKIGRATRSLTFVAGELCVGDRTVAMMQGVFKLVPHHAP